MRIAGGSGGDADEDFQEVSRPISGLIQRRRGNRRRFFLRSAGRRLPYNRGMTAAAADPLATYRPPICPQCGYSFEGLAAAGCCPECGLSYGRDHVVLFAWGPSFPLCAKSPKLLIFICSILALFAVVIAAEPLVLARFGAFTLVTGYKVAPPLLALQLFVLAEQLYIIFFLISRRRRFLRTMPAPIQLRLSADGFGFRQGLGRARLRRWHRTTTFALHTRKNGELQIILRHTRWSPRRRLYPLLAREELLAVVGQVRAWMAAVESR